MPAKLCFAPSRSKSGDIRDAASIRLAPATIRTNS
jgi:hypothetical protein